MGTIRNSSNPSVHSIPAQRQDVQLSLAEGSDRQIPFKQTNPSHLKQRGSHRTSLEEIESSLSESIDAIDPSELINQIENLKEQGVFFTSLEPPVHSPMDWSMSQANMSQAQELRAHIKHVTVSIDALNLHIDELNKQIDALDTNISILQSKKYASTQQAHVSELQGIGSQMKTELRDSQMKLADCLSQRTGFQQALADTTAQIIGEIVTSEIKAMENGAEKAQLVFQRFMSRGRMLYAYSPTAFQPQPGDTLDLLAGDTCGACGSFSVAFARCLREAGFLDNQVFGNHILNKKMTFLTRPVDDDFIDPSAQGNVYTLEKSDYSQVKRYLFSMHIVTRLNSIGYFCPTSGKSASTENELINLLVERQLQAAKPVGGDLVYYMDPQTDELVMTYAKEQTELGEGLYRWLPST